MTPDPRIDGVCDACGTEVILNETYDAVFCPLHGWREPQCGDEECDFCAGRPEFPPVQS